MSAVAHPDLGTNTSATWVFDSAAAGTGGDVEEAIAAARVDGVVVERKFRQQRLIPAFMEPRSTVVDPTGEQITITVDGRPVAILSPVVGRTRWMHRTTFLANIVMNQADPELRHELEGLAPDTTDELPL